jgi:hypothetical protein
MNSRFVAGQAHCRRLARHRRSATPAGIVEVGAKEGQQPRATTGCEQKGFSKFFKSLVKEETVPAGIPFGVAYKKLKQSVSAQVKKIRGKLNVPRERFWLTAEGLYQVAAPFGSTDGKPEATEKRPFA